MELYKEWEIGKTSQHGSQPSSYDTEFICDINFSKDGKKLVAGSSNGGIVLLDSFSQKLIVAINGIHSIVKVGFVGEQHFVSASTDYDILLWDIRYTRYPFNTLKGHSNLVRSLEYDDSTCNLISSSFDGDVRYWHIPSYMIKRNEADSEESAHYRGILFNCPGINQIAISWCCKKLLCINCKGVIYMVNNLSIDHLKKDLNFLKFDENLPLMLAWIKPNVSTNKRNSIRIIKEDDYNSDSLSILSRVHHIITHPKLPLAMIRFTSSKRTLVQRELKDWTSVYNLEQMFPVDDSTKFDTIKAFGSDVIEENLLYIIEESRYNTSIEKKASFSECGRVIASPDEDGIRLLSFSEKLDMPLSTREKRDVFEQQWSTVHYSLNTIATIPRKSNSVVCTKFSEKGILLASGEHDLKISFHQPKL